MNTELRKLAAQKMIQLHEANKDHEKRAHATRLIFKQAELGYGDVPRTYGELQEKVASLLNQNLEIVEKALELTGGNLKLGELGSADRTLGGSADDIFTASILNEYNERNL